MNARTQAYARAYQEIEQSTSRAVAARQEADARPRSALELLSQRLNVSTNMLQSTLKNTVFKGCSDAEFVALVVVANTYDLNPLLREIYAFPKKGGGIQAIVGYDGWIKIMNNHPQFDGIEFIHIEDEQGNLKAVEGVIYRKDRTRPIKKLAYLKEWKRNTEPWNNSPNHMLDVRCLCHTVRIAFGIPAGIEGDDDVVEGSYREVPPALPTREELVDAATGEVIEAEPEPERDSRGMTEVDEDTARALDAGQSDDGDPGPQPEEVEEKPVWQQKCDEIGERLAAAKTYAQVQQVEKAWVNVMAGVPDADFATRISNLITAKLNELRGKEA